MIRETNKRHVINNDEMKDIDDCIYDAVSDLAASYSSSESKSLDYHHGKKMFIVTDHRKVVLETPDKVAAVEKYNSL